MRILADQGMKFLLVSVVLLGCFTCQSYSDGGRGRGEGTIVNDDACCSDQAPGDELVFSLSK